jgi:Arc/MetJ-type ribon-helix-helix transcriptional regulator
MKPKTRYSKPCSVALSDEELELIDQRIILGEFSNRSEYIGWLIRTHNETLNPAKQLASLESQEKQIMNDLDEIRKKRQTIIENIDHIKNLEEMKYRQKPKAIATIQTSLISNDAFEAEEKAKTWGVRLGIEPTSLLAEAMLKLKAGKRVRPNEESSLAGKAHIR